MPPRMQCSFKRSGDVSLRNLLTFAAGVLSEGRLQRFSKPAGNGPEV